MPHRTRHRPTLRILNIFAKVRVIPAHRIIKPATTDAQLHTAPPDNLDPANGLQHVNERRRRRTTLLHHNLQRVLRIGAVIEPAHRPVRVKRRGQLHMRVTISTQAAHTNESPRPVRLNIQAIPNRIPLRNLRIRISPCLPCARRERAVQAASLPLTHTFLPEYFIGVGFRSRLQTSLGYQVRK